MDKLPLKIGQYALLRKNDGKILALQRKKSQKWSLPGGRLESGEDNWFEALQREIKEETGIEIVEAKPVSVNIVKDLPWQIKYCVYFIVEIASDKEVKLTGEHSSFVWLDSDNYQTVQFEYDFVRKLVDDYFEEKIKI
jgi:8-oxo-dGTP pyrophosphatase MutT (NUDIX family)